MILFGILSFNVVFAADPAGYWDAGKSNKSAQQIADDMNLPTNQGGPIKIVTNVVQFLLGFLGLLAVILILYGGYKWMTDQGTGKGIDEAKKMISAGVVGLVIIVSAFIVAEWVITQIYTQVTK